MLLNNLRYSDRTILSNVIEQHKEVFKSEYLIGTHDWITDTFTSSMTDDEYWLYDILVDYWKYSEIAFDSIERFIDRFNTYWKVYTPLYIPFVQSAKEHKLPFNFRSTDTETYLNEYSPQSTKTEGITYNSQYAYTKHSHSVLKERASQNSDSTYDDSTSTPHSGTDTTNTQYGGKDTTNRTVTNVKEISDNNYYIFIDYMKSEPFAKDFCNRFYKLFMEVL